MSLWLSKAYLIRWSHDKLSCWELAGLMESYRSSSLLLRTLLRFKQVVIETKQKAPEKKKLFVNKSKQARLTVGRRFSRLLLRLDAVHNEQLTNQSHQFRFLHLLLLLWFLFLFLFLFQVQIKIKIKRIPPRLLRRMFPLLKLLFQWRLVDLIGHSSIIDILK